MLRKPLYTVAAINVTNTLSSNQVVLVPFDDFDSLVCKLVVNTLAGTNGQNLQVYYQTTDDGGVTYYDMATTGAQTGSSITNTNAVWNTLPVNVGDGLAVGAPADGTLNASITTAKNSGLPLLSKQLRVKWVTGTLASTTTSANYNIYIYANNQSSTAS